MGDGQNFGPSGISNSSSTAGNVCQHLGHSNTLFCRSIKVTTIKKYIQAAATFHALFGNHSRDYRKTQETDSQFAPELATIYADLMRWETAPKRREPFTLLMLTKLSSRVRIPTRHSGTG